MNSRKPCLLQIVGKLYNSWFTSYGFAATCLIAKIFFVEVDSSCKKYEFPIKIYLRELGDSIVNTTNQTTKFGNKKTGSLSYNQPSSTNWINKSMVPVFMNSKKKIQCGTEISDE